MLPAVLWNTVKFGSKGDWLQFVDSNLSAHNAIAASMGYAGNSYPRAQFLTQTYSDQLAHWLEHVVIAQLQGTQVPTLIELSFKPGDEFSFYQFMSYHAYYHEVQEQAEGLI